jgi:HPt (histidine-containing phosphotransfer) domain-containing protein
MTGDRERCFAAGMDDYISKPFQKQQLLSALERFSPTGQSTAAQPTQTRTATPGVIDPEELWSRVEGDRDLLRELIDTLLTETRPLLEEITDAVKKGNPVRLERAAHKLKGAIAVFGAPNAVATAQTLESMGRETNLLAAEQVLQRLEAQLIDLQAALSDLRETCTKS